MPVNYQLSKIYTIVNDVDDNIYVGSTAQKQLGSRMAQHRRGALTGPSPIYVAMRTLGVGHFRIVLHHVFPCVNKDELESEEYKVMKAFIDAGISLYNARTAATGFKASDETKEKMAKAQTGRKHTDETKEKMAKAKMGKKFTDEHKQNIAASKKGQGFTMGSITLQDDKGKYPRWVFHYYDDAGKSRSQSWTISKYGNYGAHFRAEEARRAVYPEWGNEEDLACDDLGHIEWD